MKYKLILTVVCNLPQINRCMKSLDVPKETLIIIDNSPERLMEKYQKQGYRVHRTLKEDGSVENLGCARSWNKGIKLALEDKPDIIFLINPSEDYGSIQEQLIDNLDKASEWGLRTNLEFHCVGFTPKLFKKIGLFDENFYPIYGADNDFKRRIYLSHIKGGIIRWPLPKIDLVSNSWGKRMSVDKGVDFNQVSMLEYYHKKWGGDKLNPVGTETYALPFKNKPLDYWEEHTIEELRKEYGETVGKFINYDLPDHVKELRKIFSDIRDAIPYLYQYGLKAKIILELGVRTGRSTHALLMACKDGGGRLWSVDKDPCAVAIKKFKDNGLDEYWNFTIVVDDLDFVKIWNKKIDLLFIDTSHKLDHTLLELKLFSPFVADDGVILLHDTISDTPVMEAIQQFLFWNPEWEFKELEHHKHGLGRLRRAKTRN